MCERAIVALVALSVSSSCTDATGPNLSTVPGYLISAVRVTPVMDTAFIPPIVRAGDRVPFTATATGKNGGSFPAMVFAWSTSDPSIATVDADGLVTPHAVGEVEIRASADKIGRARLVILPASILVSISPVVDTIFVDTPIVATRDTIRLTATATDLGGAALPGPLFGWTSSAPAVATVDPNGLVRAASLGTTTISASTSGHTATAIVHVVAAGQR